MQETLVAASWWVYLCEKKGFLYTGITTNLERRIRQHQSTALLYREGPLTREHAVKREKEIKGWRRDKKIRLIEEAPRNRR
ncbi:MAG TPA: GIY-YIG nuclease family protein [Thermodesulfobacteriota bacterium]|nr:GIY-YIG nuclease family protein [Deltaproteobacteria bacterium]HNR13037.1 GIY-YIG nuclease family protein [Thermodesulfobacteriota bacterium]